MGNLTLEKRGLQAKVNKLAAELKTAKERIQSKLVSPGKT